MDNERMGSLLLKLRKEKGMTQKTVGDFLGVSDKTVSKWERGQGFPDISLLQGISVLFGVNIEKVLNGDLEKNDMDGGNMKKLNFYVCPECGNILTASSSAEISCCGRKLEVLQAAKADAEHCLMAEQVENEWYLTAEHPMTKEHYISFVAYLTGERLILNKTYPEWNLQLRIPKRGHGKLLFYCEKHGLFYQLI